MATENLEKRMAIVEQELAQLKQQMQVAKQATPLPWWEKIAGTFANSEHYDEAMRLGHEYRKALRSQDNEEAD